MTSSSWHDRAGFNLPVLIWCWEFKGRWCKGAARLKRWRRWQEIWDFERLNIPGHEREWHIAEEYEIMWTFQNLNIARLGHCCPNDTENEYRRGGVTNFTLVQLDRFTVWALQNLNIAQSGNYSNIAFVNIAKSACCLFNVAAWNVAKFKYFDCADEISHGWTLPGKAVGVVYPHAGETPRLCAAVFLILSIASIILISKRKLRLVHRIETSPWGCGWRKNSWIGFATLDFRWMAETLRFH